MENTNNNNKFDFFKPFKSIYWMGSILIAIMIVCQIFPPFFVLDSTSLRHFVFAIINTLSISFLIYYINTPNNSIPSVIFKNKITFSWLILIFFMIISIFQAMNIAESIVTLNRWLIIFLCFIFTSIYLNKKPKIFNLILIVTFILSIINLLSCIIPYYYLDVHINPRKNIYLNGLYGNKNIFAAVILFKLPFLYYLFLFRKSFLKWSSLFLIFGLTFCLVILSARTSFIGLALQFLIIISYSLFLLIRHKSKSTIIPSLFIISAITVGFLSGDRFINYNYKHYTLNSSIAKKYDMTSDNSYAVSNRLKSIEEGNSKGRLIIWDNTKNIIKENPWRGYGVGNHKLAIMKVETPKKDGFIVSDHAHNDFLEMWSELGLFGLLSYILFLISGVILFIKVQLKKNISKTYRFISLTGFTILISYINDAMFNFPLERADCQLYLALSLSLILISYIKSKKTKSKTSNKFIFYFIGLITIPIMTVETMHYSSSIMQRQKISQVNGNKKIKYTAEQWEERFPCIPTVDENVNPIALTIASRYAIEKNFRRAIDVIINDYSNPYLALKEYRLSNYYYNLGKYDSSIYWANKCIKMKPLCYDPHRILFYNHKRNNDFTSANNILEGYLKKNKNIKNAWIDLIYTKQKLRLENETKTLLDSALIYFPNDSYFINIKDSIQIQHKILQ